MSSESQSEPAVTLSLIGELCAGGLLCGGGMRTDVLGGEMDSAPGVSLLDPGVCAGAGLGDACGILKQRALSQQNSAIISRGPLSYSLLWAGDRGSDRVAWRHTRFRHGVIARIKVLPVL